MARGSQSAEEEKQAEAEASAREKAKREAEVAAAGAREAQHVASLPKWEYQVKRIGGDKQKGLLGSQRMEQIFNGEGIKGWELVAIHEERATFKRPKA